MSLRCFVKLTVQRPNALLNEITPDALRMGSHSNRC